MNQELENRVGAFECPGTPIVFIVVRVLYGVRQQECQETADVHSTEVRAHRTPSV
jgi:hypothetical protein